MKSIAVTIPSRQLLITQVTVEEYNEVHDLIEQDEWPLMDYPTLFPCKDSPERATMLLAAGMGCGGGRWKYDLLPLIEAKFPGRIVHTVEFKGLGCNG